MFRDEWEAVVKGAEGKLRLLKENPVGYLLLSMLAGAYIGFGVLLTNTIGAQLAGAVYTKTVMGLTFTVALSLVVIAGAELFTGNNLVLSAGMLAGRVKAGAAARLWAVCWLGNLAGAVILAAVYTGTGLSAGAVGAFMASGAAAKASAGPPALLRRGILCNMLVCAAVWCGFRAKSDAGKLIMIFWCLLAFVTTGFEHSIANMTLFAVVLMDPAAAAAAGVTFSGALYNLAAVTAGNMIGGICFVALPYFAAARK